MMGPDLTESEPVDEWHSEPDGQKYRIKLKDRGYDVELELMIMVTDVTRIGNDPATGAPNYNVQFGSSTVRRVKWGAALKDLPGMEHR